MAGQSRQIHSCAQRGWDAGWFGSKSDLFVRSYSLFDKINIDEPMQLEQREHCGRRIAATRNCAGPQNGGDPDRLSPVIGHKIATRYFRPAINSNACRNVDQGINSGVTASNEGAGCGHRFQAAGHPWRGAQAAIRLRAIVKADEQIDRTARLARSKKDSHLIRCLGQTPSRHMSTPQSFLKVQRCDK